MRMVLVPAPVIYPSIPIAPVEPLLPVHPLPVAHPHPTNTDNKKTPPQVIDLASSTPTPSTSTALPTNPAGPVYAPIATLEHSQSPPLPTLQIENMDDSETQRRGSTTPDASFPASIQITDVRSLRSPHTISDVLSLIHI